jgi:hypothetical protein
MKLTRPVTTTILRTASGGNPSLHPAATAAPRPRHHGHRDDR